jgi:AsmA protein
MPLLSGDIEIKRLVLEGADLRLAEGEDGAVNWDFPTEESESQPATLEDLRLGDVRLVDSRIAFTAAGAEPILIEHADATLAFDTLDTPAEVESDFEYRGQRVNAEFDIATPRALIEQAITPLVASIRAAPLNANFDGDFDAGAGTLDGRLEASGASLRNLLAWMGSPLDDGGAGFARFRAQGALKTAGPIIDLADCTLALDALEARGRVRLTALDSGQMRASGALSLAELDLNPYLPEPVGGEEAGINTDAAWDTAPIDLTGLRAIDADFDLTIAALTFQRMSFADAALNLRINNGALDARLSRVSLYGGAGTARVIADARGAIPRIAIELTSENINAEPLLRDSIGFEKLSGRGRLTASLVGQGNSQAEIMRTLNGQAAFLFRDGAWKGFNLAQIARTIESVRTGAEAGAASETDFAELAADFQVNNGVAVTENVRLLNPFVRLDGQGLINIGAQTLDLRLEPRAVRSAQGQGGAADLSGIGIPFRITGPWTSPQFRPAIEQAVRNELRTQAQRALAGREAGDPLRRLGESLFGITPEPTTEPAPEPTTEAAPEAAAPETTTPETDAAPSESSAPPEPEKQRTPEQRARDALEDLLRRN